MRTKLFSFIIVGTLLMTGVVSAYTDPVGSYPNGQVETVVHVGDEKQIKSGAFWAKLLQAGSKVTNTASLAGFMIGETFSIAPAGFFTHMILPGNGSQFRLGGVATSLGSSITNNESTSLFGYIFKNLNKLGDESNVEEILQNNRAPLTIDLEGRGESGTPASRDAIAIISGGMCSPTTIVTNASGVSFRSDYNEKLSDAAFQNEYADILARQLRLKGGNPGENKVLVAVDSLGNATWGTLKFEPVKNSGGVVTGACVSNPDYDPPRSGHQCAADVNGNCAVCSTLSESQCGLQVNNHCMWNPRGGATLPSGAVTDMKVTVEYDKANSPVRTSQLMCGFEDPETPEEPPKHIGFIQTKRMPTVCTAIGSGINSFCKQEPGPTTTTSTDIYSNNEQYLWKLNPSYSIFPGHTSTQGFNQFHNCKISKNQPSPISGRVWEKVVSDTGTCKEVVTDYGDPSNVMSNIGYSYSIYEYMYREIK